MFCFGAQLAVAAPYEGRFRYNVLHALRGAYDVLHHCEKKLGIHAGETTPDGKVTLRTAECLASCGTAPMMQVDKDYHEDLTPERVDEILIKLGANLR